MASWSSRKAKQQPGRNAQQANRPEINRLAMVNLQHKMLPSALVSVIVHLKLLIALSLVAAGTPVQEAMEILFAEIEEPGLEDFALVEAAPFEVEEASEGQPEVASESSELLASTPSFNLAAMKKPMEQPVTDSEEEGGVAEVAEGGGDGGLESASIAKRAAAIQGRVGKAGGKKGEVQFALAWKNYNDVDLHVIAPSGEHISHMHRRSQCNGMLDVDMNVRGESNEPVENVRWISNAPWGRYTVLIHLFKLNPDGPRRPKRHTEFQLMAQLGSETLVKSGDVSIGGQQVIVLRFKYIAEKASAYEKQQFLQQLDELQQREEAAAKPMLAEALAANEKIRDRKLENIVRLYPHTDAAIEALQSIGGDVVKR
jgi:hypothetical protein